MVDTFEGRCRLDWRANRATVLGTEVDVVVAATASGWRARARVVGGTADELEGLALLCEVDPLFTLRLGDGSAVPVEVRVAGQDGELVLTEPGPGARAASPDAPV